MLQLQLTDLEEIFRALEQSGMRPMLCDCAVTYYDTGVHAGTPTMIFDPAKGDYLAMPRELVGLHPTFVIPVIGDSMKEADVEDGDQITLEVCDRLNDGDIVVASIDGEHTVKTYFVDEDGDHWLVPRNKAYKPIRLTEEMNIHFYGRVVNIIKSPRRPAFGELARCVRQAKEAEKEVKTPTNEQMEVVVRRVEERVKTVRQWYAVYRALVSKRALREGDYELFVSKVTEWLPLHPHPIDARELRRMESMSFRKSPLLWDRENAPVTGKRFDDYRQIAIQVMEELDKM